MPLHEDCSNTWRLKPHHASLTCISTKKSSRPKGILCSKIQSIPPSAVGVTVKAGQVAGVEKNFFLNISSKVELGGRPRKLWFGVVFLFCESKNLLQ